MRETTALGAAYLAGLATGMWSGTDEIKTLAKDTDTFTPNMSEQDRVRCMGNWHEAVKRSLGWVKR